MLPRERLRLEVESLIKRFIDEVFRKYSPSCIILFGSYVKGDFTESSDVDICVISNELPEDLIERRTIITGIKKIRALGFKEDEFFRMLDEMNPLVLDIVYEGRPLFGEEIFRRYKKKLKKMIKRGFIEKYKDGWRYKSTRLSD